MESKKLLAFYSIKYDGDWNKIFNAVKERETYSDEEIEKGIESLDSNYITILDEGFNESLKKKHNPPLVLFYKGDISLLNDNHRFLAVCGSRDPSDYGNNTTKEIVGNLSKKEKDIVFISGLTKGIDTTTIKTALENNSKVIAVLPYGINYSDKNNTKTIAENKLANEIIANGGLVLSEYPNDVAQCKENYPSRNRIIAGVCDKLLIPEAKVNSGTALTMLMVLQQGKDVMAVPHNINPDLINNKIIQDGAFLVQDSEDVQFMMSGLVKEKEVFKSKDKGGR